MVANPMQRKARISFLLGMLVMLCITGAIIILLFFGLKEKVEELNNIEKSKVLVYTLSQNVKAGEILTEDMFALKKVQKDLIPGNATATSSVIESWFLQTKSGETVQTDKYGLYLNRSSEDNPADTIIEVRQNNGEEFKDSKDQTVKVGDYYVELNGSTEKVPSLDSVIQDEYETGMYIVDTRGNDTVTRVYQESITGEFYIFKIDTTTLTTSKQRVKEYLDIKNVPVLAKVNMDKNTVITPQLVVQSDQIVTDDTRQEQYNMIELPIDLMTSDYVDIRLMTPSGQNFIVASKLQVEIPMNADGTYIANTVRVNLREDEILAMSSAIVEAYGIEGAKLYATRYVDPAMQKEATVTYTPNAAVTAQIQSNPNIVEVAKAELAARYSEHSKYLRNEFLNQDINSDNVSSQIQEKASNSSSVRQKYLQSLQ